MQVVCVVWVIRLVAFTFGDGGVKPEELGDGYADRGEGKGGAEPGEKCTFWTVVNAFAEWVR